MDGFKEAVQMAWNRPVTSTQPLKRRQIKMACTAKSLKKWKKSKIGDTKLQLAMVKEIILCLETTQEVRALTLEELDLLRRLKLRSIGLALIEKARIRQRSRLTYIRFGDANTKFFQLRANSRSRKNYIHYLQTEEGLAFSHDDKEKIITDHFRQHLGTTIGRPATFNWSSLGYQAHDLSSLEEPFSQQEIKDTIDSMPMDKAPGPDGFTGIFFKECWEIIKDDLTAAFNQLHNLNAQGFDFIKLGQFFLLPKKLDAIKVGDYRPISLILSIAKNFSKLLANRLAPHLNKLVSKCQSAFIKHRCIQDNFLYIQNTVRRFQKMKIPALFMKLDIQKAFDTVN